MKARLVLIIAIVILFNSCIGVSFDIQFNRDSSGRLTMEYRISRILLSMGELDGNEMLTIIPFQRGDMERMLEGVPGTRLVSYSRRETSSDIYINASIDFPDANALTSLLSSNTGNVSIANNGQAGSINIIILDEPSPSQYDENMMRLMKSAFEGYNFAINLNSYAPSSVTVTNGIGAASSIPAQAAVSQGRRSSFTMKMMDILEQPDGIGVTFNW